MEEFDDPLDDPYAKGREFQKTWVRKRERRLQIAALVLAILATIGAAIAVHHINATMPYVAPKTSK